MPNWFAVNDNLRKKTESLRNDIGYHLRALDCCTIQFPYYRDIKTSLAECYAQLAHEYYHAGEYNNALNFYKKATEHNHHHFQARNQMGYIYFDQKKYDAAIECFEKIVSLATESYDAEHKADALLSLALIYAHLNNKSGMDKAYKYVINADRVYPDYQLTNKIMQDIMHLEKINYKLQKSNSETINDTQEEKPEMFTSTL